eukprot:TRINITY_DN6264_c0_g1_i1.p1 TRINITY_DN6264_c0_g1~~TRINITY_DN6264_c0_g1_i1.p1  ORF type:complete len:544 (+),score=105.26 TRINITY_DN6264_c0_g1_i1:214-1845(+)
MEKWPQVQMVLAAVMGASIVAASAYYLHKRTLEQLMQLKKKMDSAAEDATAASANRRRRRQQHSHLHSRVHSRNSYSVPNFGVTSGFDDDDDNSKEKRCHCDCHGKSTAPLSRLHPSRQGSRQSLHGSNCTIRTVPTVAAIDSVANARSFGNVARTEDEEELVENGDEQNYSYEETDGDTMAEEFAVIPENNHHVTSGLDSNFSCLNGEKDQTTVNGMIKTRSIPGDLHGLHVADPVAANILRKEPEQETFARLIIEPTDPPSAEEEEVCLMLQECLGLRNRYVFKESIPPWEKESITEPGTPKRNSDPFLYVPEAKSEHHFKMENGVVQVYENKDAEQPLFPVPDATAFFTDMHRILKIIALGNVRTLCHNRLRLLEQKFSLHLMLNADREALAQKSAPHRDFYNVRKVDTHVHHSSCMHQKHLLRFIKSKLRKEPDEVVIFRDGIYLTLKEVFESLDLTGYDLNVDLLDVHADKNTFHRFDRFNLKYNPCGQSRLREIFLKQDNLIQGRFLGELTKQVFSDLAASKYQVCTSYILTIWIKP